MISSVGTVGTGGLSGRLLIGSIREGDVVVTADSAL